MATSPIGNTSLDSAGLSMQALLQIILTQLTYQDPLKPVDNYEFVSQLAQFTELEQTRQLNDKVDNLLSVQSATQTLGLLSRNVDVQTDTGLLSGVVKSVSFKGDQPELTIESASGQIVTNARISQVVQVR